jgi:hypothetical protein
LDELFEHPWSAKAQAALAAGSAYAALGFKVKKPACEGGAIQPTNSLSKLSAAQPIATNAEFYLL